MSFEKDVERTPKSIDQIDSPELRAKSVIDRLENAVDVQENADSKYEAQMKKINDASFHETSINDVKSAERINNAVKNVENLFNAKDVYSRSDVGDIGLDNIDELFEGLSGEELLIPMTVYCANKIELMTYVTNGHRDGFIQSKQRQDLVDDVKTTLVKSNAFTEWCSDVGDAARDKVSDARDTVTEVASDVSDVVEDKVEDAQEVLSDAADWAEDRAHQVADYAREGVAALAELAIDASDEVAEFVDNAEDAVRKVIDYTPEQYERIREEIRELRSDAGKVADVVGDNIEAFARDVAEVVVDAGEAAGFITGKLALGVLKPAENITDFVCSMALEATGNEEGARYFLENDMIDALDSKLDEWYDGPGFIEAVGSCVSTLGELATDVALMSLAFSKTNAVITALAYTGIGLEGAGSVLNEVFDKTGELGPREIIAAIVGGTASTAAVYAMGRLNNYIVNVTAKHIGVNLLKVFDANTRWGGRVLGSLTLATMGAADAGLFSATDIATDLTNVALGIEDDFDVIQKLKDTLLSMGAASLVCGLGYGIADATRASAWYQKIFDSKYTPDYFGNLYDQIYHTREYYKALISVLPDDVMVDLDKITWEDLYLRDTPETQSLREAFESHKKKLIHEWEIANNTEWPRYTEDVINPRTGKVIRHAGDRYDAHHIIPLGLGGDNAATNLAPIHVLDHISIHSASSSYSHIVNDVSLELSNAAYGLLTGTISNAERGEH